MTFDYSHITIPTRNLPRIGTIGKPDREWEVWDQGARTNTPPRWFIWHPALIGTCPACTENYATLEDALAAIRLIEMGWFVELDTWRNTPMDWPR